MSESHQQFCDVLLDVMKKRELGSHVRNIAQQRLYCKLPEKWLGCEVDEVIVPANVEVCGISSAYVLTFFNAENLSLIDRINGKVLTSWFCDICGGDCEEMWWQCAEENRDICMGCKGTVAANNLMRIYDFSVYKEAEESVGSLCDWFPMLHGECGAIWYYVLLNYNPASPYCGRAALLQKGLRSSFRVLGPEATLERLCAKLCEFSQRGITHPLVELWYSEQP